MSTKTEPTYESVSKELVTVMKATLKAVGILAYRRSEVTEDLRRLRDLIRKMSDSHSDSQTRIRKIEKGMAQREGHYESMHLLYAELQELVQIMKVQVDGAYVALQEAIAEFEKHTKNFWRDYDKWYAEPDETRRMKKRRRKQIEEVPGRISNVEARIRVLEKIAGIERGDKQR